MLLCGSNCVNTGMMLMKRHLLSWYVGHETLLGSWCSRDCMHRCVFSLCCATHAGGAEGFELVNPAVWWLAAAENMSHVTEPFNTGGMKKNGLQRFKYIVYTMDERLHFLTAVTCHRQVAGNLSPALHEPSPLPSRRELHDQQIRNL